LAALLCQVPVCNLLRPSYLQDLSVTFPFLSLQMPVSSIQNSLSVTHVSHAYIILQNILIFTFRMDSLVCRLIDLLFSNLTTAIKLANAILMLFRHD